MTIFGPKKYQRTTGAPNDYQDTFRAIQGTGIVRIQNGSSAGDDRMTSAVVTLNGKEIFRPSDFKKSVYILEKSVDLANGINTIEVELRSKPGSYITIQITEDVPAPAVTFTAEPTRISYGQSTILRWTSSGADYCTITPGIGRVDANGIRTVAPAETTAYAIAATGLGGTATQSLTVEVSRIELSIDYPAEGASVNGLSTTVTGTVLNPSGAETGISVNGVAATVLGNVFVANRISLESGTNTIVVKAADASGSTASKSVTVQAAPVPENFVRLSANPGLGVAPLTVRLSIIGSFGIVAPTITSAGPGTVERLASENPDECIFSIQTEGFYTFRVQAAGPDGITYEDAVIVPVTSQAALETLLRAKWTAIESALAAKDTGAALNLIHCASKSRYEEVFRQTKDLLPEIAASYRGLVLNHFGQNVASYELRAIRNGSVFRFPVVFIKDPVTGLWFIQEF